MNGIEERVINITKKELNKIDVEIDSIAFIRSNNQNVLDITLISDKTLDLNLIVTASKIIKKKLDEEDFILADYILDCHSKVGGMK